MHDPDARSADRSGDPLGQRSPGAPAAERSQVLYRRFVRAWIPVVLGLLLVEVAAAPLTARPELFTLVVLTALVGIVTIPAARGLSRPGSGRLQVVAALVLDVAAIATGLISSAGNDVALMLPYIGAVVLVSALGSRALVAAFACQWLAGMVAAGLAYGVSDLRLVPGAEPLVVSMATAGSMSMIAYGLLWWVRERLSRALTATREAERAARRSASVLEALVRSSPVPTIGCDLTGAIRTWNPAAEAAFGWSAGEVIGCNVAVLAGEPADAAGDWVRRALTGASIDGIRVSWRHRGGAEIVVDLHAALLHDADGNPVGVVGQAIDETEREALRARVAEAERLEAIGQLAGGIAHNFNNLLTAIAGYAELIAAGSAADDPRHGDAVEVERAAARGADLVRQLLAFGRRREADPVVVDLSELVTGLLPMLERLVGAQAVIRPALADRPCRVLADRSQLEQAIVNLVINARDAIPDGGTIEIGTAAPCSDDGSVRLWVTDTGTGMDAETAARVFEPFFSTKAASLGSGLGLTTVYATVTAAGGRVDVRSAIGRGTTIEVHLPMAAEAALDATAAAGSGTPVADALGPAKGSETILVVDDEEQVRHLAVRTLDRLGYRVLEAGDRASALEIATREALAARSIDLVLSDVVMPDVRGPALVRDLLSIHPDVKVVYMTAYVPDEVLAAPGAGPEAPVVAKPFSLDVLGREIRARLDGGSPTRSGVR